MLKLVEKQEGLKLRLMHETREYYLYALVINNILIKFYKESKKFLPEVLQ